LLASFMFVTCLLVPVLMLFFHLDPMPIITDLFKWDFSNINFVCVSCFNCCVLRVLLDLGLTVLIGSRLCSSFQSLILFILGQVKKWEVNDVKNRMYTYRLHNSGMSYQILMGMVVGVTTESAFDADSYWFWCYY
jgi:hypothetical protein